MEASQFCFNHYNYYLGCQLENQKTFWYAKNLRESESEVICPEKNIFGRDEIEGIKKVSCRI